MGNGVNDELIRKKDALDALMAERKHLLAKGQKGAEHILTHHGYNVIAELDVPDTNVGDMISRQAAIDAIQKLNIPEDMCVFEIMSHIEVEIATLPPVQPKRGKWVKISPANIYECSKCGKHVMTNDISAYDFCHGCGADMRGEAE